MSVERAYIFPNILPEDGLIFPLSQLFAQVFFLRPVEDDLPEADTPLLRELTKQQGSSGCLRYSCPAPLADDRDRFLGLLRDIRLRPEDYVGHLGNLSAGLGSAVRQDEQESSIVDTLLRQTGIRTGFREHTPEPGKRQEKNASSVLLWQARLLLKLGESLDRDQAEIRRNLDMMSRQQEQLLRGLREEQGGEILDPAFSLFSTEDEIPLKQQRLRLKAWSRLFALSEERFEHTAFISSSPDAVESLLERYRQEHAGTARQLTLSLPAFLAEEKDVLSGRDRFQKEAGELINAMRAFPTASAAHSVFTEEAGEKWSDLLERHYPAAEHGRCTLTLYFLPEITPQRLFLETFAVHDDLSAHPMTAPAGTGTFLGILK